MLDGEGPALGSQALKVFGQDRVRHQALARSWRALQYDKATFAKFPVLRRLEHGAAQIRTRKGLRKNNLIESPEAGTDHGNTHLH